MINHGFLLYIQLAEYGLVFLLCFCIVLFFFVCDKPLKMKKAFWSNNKLLKQLSMLFLHHSIRVTCATAHTLLSKSLNFIINFIIFAASLPSQWKYFSLQDKFKKDKGLIRWEIAKNNKIKQKMRGCICSVSFWFLIKYRFFLFTICQLKTEQGHHQPCPSHHCLVSILAKSFSIIWRTTDNRNKDHDHCNERNCLHPLFTYCSELQQILRENVFSLSLTGKDEKTLFIILLNAWNVNFGNTTHIAHVSESHLIIIIVDTMPVADGSLFGDEVFDIGDEILVLKKKYSLEAIVLLEVSGEKQLNELKQGVKISFSDISDTLIDLKLEILIFIMELKILLMSFSSGNWIMLGYSMYFGFQTIKTKLLTFRIATESTWYWTW